MIAEFIDGFRFVQLGPLAQSVEQRTFNPWVVGSIPTGPTLEYRKTEQFFSKLPQSEGNI
jgi:hypothetical protein